MTDQNTNTGAPGMGSPAPQPAPVAAPSFSLRRGDRPRPLWPSIFDVDRWVGWKAAPDWLGPDAQVKRATDGSTRIRLRSGGELIDTGTSIQISEAKPGWETVETAALAAVARFGLISPSGPPEFVMQAWAVAERRGLPVHVPPQLQALRQQYQDYHRDRLLTEAHKKLGSVQSSPLQERAQARMRQDAEHEKERARQEFARYTQAQAEAEAAAEAEQKAKAKEAREARALAKAQSTDPATVERFGVLLERLDQLLAGREAQRAEVDALKQSVSAVADFVQKAKNARQWSGPRNSKAPQVQ